MWMLGFWTQVPMLVWAISPATLLLSLSFYSHSKILHTQSKHSDDKFSFYEQPGMEECTTTVDLMGCSIRDSEHEVIFLLFKVSTNWICNPTSVTVHANALCYHTSVSKLELIQNCLCQTKWRAIHKRSTTEVWNKNIIKQQCALSLD